MPYPNQTFNTFAELLIYINNEIVTNGNEEIDAVKVNNVVNGLLTFVEQSPLNWQKAQIVSTGGNVTPLRPIVVIAGTAPTSIQWNDNIYNQYIFINTTSSSIPIGNSQYYYNIDLVAQTSIPSKSIVNIVKAFNNTWIIASTLSSGGSVVQEPLCYVVGGGGGAPVNGQDTWQNNGLIGLGVSNNNRISITLGGNVMYNYGAIASFTLDNVVGSITLLNGNTFVTGDPIYVDRNQ
jgi:hypothetical protein